MEIKVWREHPYWVIEVPGVGFTQARTEDEIEYMARALVEDMKGG